MASVYRRRCRDAKGEYVPGKYEAEWRFKYKDRFGKWRHGIGWTDKKKTLQHARDVESEHRAVFKGDKEAPAHWQKNRNTLASVVVADYMAWGRMQGGRNGKGWDSQNANLKKVALDEWLKELNITVLAEIEMVQVEKRLQELRKRLKPKSVYLKVEALKSLLRWAVDHNFLSKNPLSKFTKLDTEAQDPHRALTDDEVAKLLSKSPPEHRLWYETALATGFRVNELRNVRVSDLDMFGPSIFLKAEFSKDRKDHRQPIPRELADSLKALAKGKERDEPLLDIPSSVAYKRIAEDYIRAGVLPSTTEGKATWHSLRKTFINNLVKGGADLKTVMTLARHSTAQLTMETYAQADPALLRTAAENVVNKVHEAVLTYESCQNVAKQCVGAEVDCVSGEPEMACVCADENSGLVRPQSRAPTVQEHLETKCEHSRDSETSCGSSHVQTTTNQELEKAGEVHEPSCQRVAKGLQQVIERWPFLSESLREKILSML